MPNQYLNPLKSRPSLHCNGTESEDVVDIEFQSFDTILAQCKHRIDLCRSP